MLSNRCVESTRQTSDFPDIADATRGDDPAKVKLGPGRHRRARVNDVSKHLELTHMEVWASL